MFERVIGQLIGIYLDHVNLHLAKKQVTALLKLTVLDRCMGNCEQVVDAPSQEHLSDDKAHEASFNKSGMKISKVNPTIFMANWGLANFGVNIFHDCV
jgi:hypothetical protein